METFDNRQEEITSQVKRVMQVVSITTEGPDSRTLVRYRGLLTKDSQEAYDQLAAALKPYRITPLFSEENDQHIVTLMDGVIDPKPSNPWVNLALFLLTLVSMVLAGALFSYDGPVSDKLGEQLLLVVQNWKTGIPFGVSLLAILLTHEFGHYLAARYHKTNVTLPYFIPFPLSPFGTMGAFIQLKEPPKNKRILHDIGVAGPLAGLVVAIPILLIGLSLSPVETIWPSLLQHGGALTVEGNSILYLAAKYLTHGELLPAPASYGSVPPLLYWLRYFFTGYPAPFGSRDVMLHPLAWAGWAGLLVTALNLIPAGQLDGGHALYVLMGKKAQRVLPFVIWAMFLLGLVWSGWWLWVALIFFFGQRYAEPLDQITKLDSRRKAVAILTLIIFVLVFTPIPLQQFGG